MTALLVTTLLAAAFVPATDVTFVKAKTNLGTTNIEFTTAFRVDRPLPQGPTGVFASIAIDGTDEDVGVVRQSGTRTCYWAQNSLLPHQPVPRDGQDVTVRLNIGGRRPVVITQRVRARVDTDTASGPRRRRAALIRRLACPRTPPERTCNGAVEDKDGAFVAIDAAGGGATCATARRVLRPTLRWIDTGACLDLCVSRHRRNAGFRCTVAKIGEAYWTITCRRGRQVVRGSTSE